LRVSPTTLQSRRSSGIEDYGMKENMKDTQGH
jgi:hypothetical protein